MMCAHLRPQKRCVSTFQGLFWCRFYILAKSRNALKGRKVRLRTVTLLVLAHAELVLFLPECEVRWGDITCPCGGGFYSAFDLLISQQVTATALDVMITYLLVQDRVVQSILCNHSDRDNEVPHSFATCAYVLADGATLPLCWCRDVIVRHKAKPNKYGSRHGVQVMSWWNSIAWSERALLNNMIL